MSNLTSILNETNSYPLWLYINDSIMIIGSCFGIFMGLLFVYTIYRLDHPDYSFSNLITCNACLSISLTCSMMLFNAYFALKSDFRGKGYFDSLCIFRGTLLKIFNTYMYASLCLKAFNRFRGIIYYQKPFLTSYRSFVIIIISMWLISILLNLIILLTGGITYEWDSHLCLVPVTKRPQFIFMMCIYYLSIFFIIGLYLYILHYVYQLPLLERYRRKRQLALLRRILVLVIMILIPGIMSTFLLIHWSLFGWIPKYSFKIRNLLDTIGFTGSVITIFISHTKIRRQYYQRKKKPNSQPLKIPQIINYESILLKDLSKVKPEIKL